MCAAGSSSSPAASAWTRSSPPAPGGSGRRSLDDEVHLALLVVLERLTPAERVAFVLHDIFGLPYDTVAGATGRTAPSCRQLAHRARLAVRAGRPARPDVDPAHRRAVTERFLAACANGDLDGLVAVLSPDVRGRADLGPTGRRSGVVRHGARAVAANLLRYFGPSTTLVEIPATGARVALVAFVAGRLYAGSPFARSAAPSSTSR